MAVQSRYLVGIDLGTTHTVVAYADSTERTEQSAPPIRIFEIDQLVSPGQVAALPVLPSTRFVSTETLSDSDKTLPWGRTRVGDEADQGVVGRLAQVLGEKAPTRLVSSAKSWLSHGAVDRSAPILPWGAPDSVEKVSPVFASASYLAHIRDAWDAKMARPLSTQEVVLTVPASFDESARGLTLQAAKDAGLKVRLVEEPQAAFYSWLDTHRSGLADALGTARLAIVVDVGGGTTDLTLLKIELRESGPRLTRIAVGDHLMLGGDNMDLALAKQAEQRLGKQLDATRFSQLVRECRRAKETLLADGATQDEVSVSVLGSSSKLVGGAQKAVVHKDDVKTIALNGFFPEVGLDAAPTKRGGIMEFGLPYVADAGITRHVAAFVSRHEKLAREALTTTDTREAPNIRETPNTPAAVPDAVLFNGGVFQSSALKGRMTDVLSSWRGSDVRVLENDAPDLAVARGAVAYALARRGVGLKIGGGSPRSYFLVVDRKGSADDAHSTGVCVLPRGSEEGEEVELPERTFSLKLGRPVRFHVVSSTADVNHIAVGDLVDIDDPERYRALPPIAAVLEGNEDDKAEIPVRLSAALTEIGTLEMSCIDAENADRRWKMELQLRGAVSSDAQAHKVRQLHPRFADANGQVKLFYGKSKGAVERKVKRLRGDLEQMLGPREEWDTPLLREVFGALLAGLKRRRRSADHERVWFHLVGYTLRPGFGFPLDEWRVKELLPVLKQGLQFSPEAQNWSEYWTMWRRVAGGLPKEAQNELMDQLEYYLRPPGGKPMKRPAGPKKLGYDEMVRLAGTLERVPVERKTKIGGWLVERLDQHDEHAQSWWAVGRIGARVPVYGSAHQVVPPNVATQWLDRALTFDFKDAQEAAFAATLISRVSGDRQRDLSEGVRNVVAERLEQAGAPDSWRAMVLDVVHLDEKDEKRMFGDSMPPGLRLLD